MGGFRITPWGERLALVARIGKPSRISEPFLNSRKQVRFSHLKSNIFELRIRCRGINDENNNTV